MKLYYKTLTSKIKEAKMKKLKSGRVVISVDPGYDGTKVTVNGEKFSIPKKTVKKIGNEYESVGSLEGIHEVVTDAGAFLCGPNIKILVDDNKDFHERFDSKAEQNNNYSYFATNEFVANTMAAISIALVKADTEKIINLDNLDKADINLVVSLPHEALESMSQTVINALVGLKNITFKGTVDGNHIERELSYEIKSEKIFVISQVIACLIGYITDEDGYEIDSLQDEYPALVVDGGYYTIGDFGISKTKAISGAKSKTEYGMRVIHENTANAINAKCHTNYKFYDMDNLFDEEDGIVIIPKNISKSGKNESFDCKEILNEETEKVFKEYLTYLEEKHNYFTKTKQILFGGGTGKIYYELFLKEADNYPNVKAKLVTYELDGETVTPREAISVGAYKMVLNRLED